jgi:HEAT repeat protein/TolA-binding protein
MKRLSAFAALLMLMLVPLVAAAQSIPPVPPVPPAPPAPAVAPVPPLPPVPPVRVRGSAYVDSDMVERAMQASRDAIERLDMDAIREQTQMARDAVQQARDTARQATEDIQLRGFSMPSFNYDFNFDFQNQNVFTTRSGNEGGAYSSGLSSIQNGKYDQAIVMFDRVIAQKGPRADAALYHKAFAQYRLGKTDDALATIAELRKSYAQSRYLSDARVLKADVKKTNGQPLNVDANDDEMKILAIQALQTSDPARAVPLLENVLKNTNTLKVKKMALFVLAGNDLPAAHQILVSYAKGGGNPDLQLEAIRYLVSKRTPNTTAELMSIYDATQDLDVRTAVVNALANAGDRAGLMRVITAPGSNDVRSTAISRLGNDNMATPQELMTIYQKEETKELRQGIVRALGSIGAVDQLVQIARTDKEPAVRQQAIRSLGNQKTERTGQALSDLYASQTDVETRRSIMSALGNQNNAEGLIAIARKETNSDLKIDIVRRIADLAKGGKSKAATDYMAEFIK